jgi:hypothetical protein
MNERLFLGDVLMSYSLKVQEVFMPVLCLKRLKFLGSPV